MEFLCKIDAIVFYNSEEEEITCFLKAMNYDIITLEFLPYLNEIFGFVFFDYKLTNIHNNTPSFSSNVQKHLTIVSQVFVYTL